MIFQADIVLNKDVKLLGSSVNLSRQPKNPLDFIGDTQSIEPLVPKTWLYKKKTLRVACVSVVRALIS